MGTFFKEQLHLKEPFQTFKSLTPLQHPTRTDRMKFLLPILLISLAALCNIQPAAAEEEAEAQGCGVECKEVPAPEGSVTPELEEKVKDEESTKGHSVQRRWTYRQKIALRKWAAFFKYADTNRTGQVTWSEFWVAVYKILRHKGYSASTI